MFDLGAPELIVILVIVMLLFGVGRISKVAGEMGQAVRSFRAGLQDESDPLDSPPAEQAAGPAAGPAAPSADDSNLPS